MMAAKFEKFVPILILCCLLPLVTFSQAAKLNVPRILLPFNAGIPSNYTLEVKEGGCFKWSSNRYDLVSVLPLASANEKTSCTTKALVSAVSRHSERNHAIILAEDEKSGQTLRCDVVIDSLHSIEIVTTTRVLYLEDAPEIFEVVAKNEKGDTFSSLSGISFHWSLESDSTDVYDVLRFLKFADSFYKTPPEVAYWEQMNLHGSKILIEGSKTGTAKVVVKPSIPAFEHVDAQKVYLVIVANLNLRPAYIHLLPGSRVKLTLEILKQGKPSSIFLPSNQYYLEVVNSSVAELDVQSSVVTAVNYGSTSIVVKDRYVTEKAVAYLPSSVIHVTHPSYMTFSVYPGSQWSLEEQKSYIVSVQIFDKNSHLIQITQDAEVSVKFPAEHFTVGFKTKNGTFHEVETLMPGTCKIYGHLVGVMKDGKMMEIEPRMSASQDVTIYKRILVNPPFVLLAWDPVVKPTYSINLSASGGTGNFNWKLNDSSLGSVVPKKEEQRALVHSFGLGTFKVLAMDAHLPLFSGSALISIQDVVDMDLKPLEVEVEVNGSLTVPVAMYGYGPGKKLKMFDDCSKIPVATEIEEIQKIRSVSSTAPVPAFACQNIALQCHTKGFNRIHVRYESVGTSLKKSLLIGCHRKLKVMSDKIVLALGTSSDITFEGGPLPWPLNSTFVVKNSPQHQYVSMLIVPKKSDDVDVYKLNAVCSDYGSESFLFSVGNKPCDSNLNPAHSEITFKVHCSMPHAIKLWPVLPALRRKECLILRESSIPIYNQRDLEIELVVEDDSGQIFRNISTLDILWKLSNKSLAKLSIAEGVKHRHVLAENGYPKPVFFQTLQLNGLRGSLVVSASITGYKDSQWQSLHIQKSMPITNSQKFNLVEEMEVVPKVLSIFNSPSNKVFLNITKGSGHFEVEASDKKKASVVYERKANTIQIIPLETGTFFLSVTDLCLGITSESAVEVHIYGISAIVVDVLDKVEIGHSITAVVSVLNEKQTNIPASMFQLMNLQPVSASNHVAFRSLPLSDPNHFLYKIEGLSLGVATFKIVTNADFLKDKQCSSPSYSIQVFAPLKLSPSHVTLVKGATFQVFYSGGPQPQSSIEFFFADDSIAFVSLTGVVEAKKVGQTTLHGKSVGFLKNGSTVIFSEDKVVVNCILLKEIQIKAPLSRLIAGSEMPLYVSGVVQGESPFTFGAALPAFRIKWTVSNDKVAALFNLYEPVGLQESDENNFQVGLRALKEGVVTVHVELSLHKDTILSFGDQQLLSSDVQIQVFEKLKLTYPDNIEDMIVMSPNSELQLKCNRFGSAKIKYEILSSCHNMGHAPAVSVNSLGHLVASSRTGSVTLLVTSTEEFGVIQEISHIVKVEEIGYLMVHPTESIQTQDWPLATLPVGFPVLFAITYHDKSGLQFSAVRSQLKFRASRYDLARISIDSTNTTLTVEVVKPGLTVLKVWDVEPSVPADYIKIKTGPAIVPSDVLTVGDVVCFSSPLLTKEGHKGTWASSKHFLNVDPVSGVAVALAKGVFTITYTLSDGYSTSIKIHVEDAERISFELGSISFISNFPLTKALKIPIIIQKGDVNRVSNIVGTKCPNVSEISSLLHQVRKPFECKLRFTKKFTDFHASDLFAVKSGFDVGKGMYVCSIEPITQVPSSEVSALDSQLSLSVHLDSVPLAQESILAFVPSFHVHQQEVSLSEVHSSATIVITATKAVQQLLVVLSSEPNILQVQGPMSNLNYPELVNYVIELRSNAYQAQDVPLHVDISCHLIKQHVQVPIKLRHLSSSTESRTYCAPSPSLPYNVDLHFAIIIIFATLVSCIVLYIVFLLNNSRRGKVTSQPVFLHSTHDSSQFSPIHNSPPPYSPAAEDFSGTLRLHSSESPSNRPRRRFDHSQTQL